MYVELAGVKPFQGSQEESLLEGIVVQGVVGLVVGRVKGGGTCRGPHPCVDLPSFALSLNSTFLPLHEWSSKVETCARYVLHTMSSFNVQPIDRFVGKSATIQRPKVGANLQGFNRWSSEANAY